MKIRAGLTACVCAAGVLFAGCGGTTAPQTSGSMSQDYVEKSKALGSSMSGMGSKGSGGGADMKKYQDAQKRGGS